MMDTIGIIYNPLSRRNSNRALSEVGSLAGKFLLRHPRSHSELDGVMEELAARHVSLIAIDGGDGTVRDVLTAAAKRFDRIPPVALLSSGRTNVIAEDVGSWGHGTAALERLVEAMRGRSRPLIYRDRATLSIMHGTVRRVGFVFGTAAFRRGTMLSRGRVPTGFGHRLRTGLSIAKALTSVTMGHERHLWLAGTPMTIVHEGVNIEEETAARFIFLATTLNRFMLGIFPFWGETTQTIRYLDVAAPPARFKDALLPVLRGHPKPWMAGAGYRSGSSSRIRLALAEPFVLDGEEYSPSDRGIVDIEAGPTIRFISP